MHKSALRTSLVLLVILAVAGCPPQKGGRGGGGSSGIDADSCGNISTNDVGRKVYSFLQASAALDRSSAELEISVRGACRKMAHELGISEAGDTKTVCQNASKALRDNLEISVSTESRMVTRYTEPVCTTDVNFQASIVAECEATLAADVDVRCEGTCGGTCSGECDGTCSGGGSGGACDGQCDGTCQGRCEGECHGYASVDASVECKASAEVRASVETTCTEPKVEVVREDVTVIDDSKFQKAMAAIDVGMPTILRAGAKAAIVLRAAGVWVKTLAQLVKSSGELVAQLGEKGLCVGAQLATAFAAAAQVQARVSVSIEVSVDVSASASASAN
jgi:hypothetical protein